jgi:hypothetical protein
MLAKASWDNEPILQHQHEQSATAHRNRRAQRQRDHATTDHRTSALDVERWTLGVERCLVRCDHEFPVHTLPTSRFAIQPQPSRATWLGFLTGS